MEKDSQRLPIERKFADDRAPTLEEINRIIEYPDRTIRPIVYVTVSSGIRLGAWDYLRWGHVKPVQRENGVIVAARLTVYGAEDDDYSSYITSEAYNSLKQ